MNWRVVMIAVIFPAACFPTLGLGVDPIDDAESTKVITGREVQTALQNWSDTVFNLGIHWTSHSDMDVLPTLGPTATREQLDSWYSISSFYWTESGAWRYESSNYGDGKLVSFTVIGANAEEDLNFEGTFSVDGGRKQISRLTLNRFNTAMKSTGILPLTGWMRPGGRSWLVDEIALPERFETAPGSNCIQVNLGTDRIWLNADHGFLVDRLEFDVRDGIWSFKVTDYVEVLPGIWLPKAGEYSRPELGTTNVTTWEVTDVRVNEVISAEIFLPPRPEKGTVVINELVGRTYRHDFSQWDRIREIASQAKRDARSWERGILRGRPPDWWVLRAGLLAAELALLGLLVMFPDFARQSDATTTFEER